MNLLKTHKELIARLERDGFVVEPLRYAKGDHLRVQVKRDGRRGSITLAGSPGDRMAHHQVLRGARMAVQAKTGSTKC